MLFVLLFVHFDGFGGGSEGFLGLLKLNCELLVFVMELYVLQFENFDFMTKFGLLFGYLDSFCFHVVFDFIDM